MPTRATTTMPMWVNQRVPGPGRARAADPSPIDPARCGMLQS